MYLIHSLHKMRLNRWFLPVAFLYFSSPLIGLHDLPLFPQHLVLLSDNSSQKFNLGSNPQFYNVGLFSALPMIFVSSQPHFLMVAVVSRFGSTEIPGFCLVVLNKDTLLLLCILQKVQSHQGCGDFFNVYLAFVRPWGGTMSHCTAFFHLVAPLLVLPFLPNPGVLTCDPPGIIQLPEIVG